MQTIFIALQCYQCSTMQVKQKKKSSNKWTCVVCNQKQSVRKVFAQSYMAKDLRKFVQSFNMSRKIADDQDFLDQEAALISTSETDHTGLNEDFQRKRRSDWIEYLDAEEDYNVQQEDEGEESGPMVVTELPKEMFKKPKLKKYDFGPGSGHHSDGNPCKLVLPKRDTSKVVMSQDKESRKYQPTKAAGNSKWSDYMTQVEEAMISQPTMGKPKASEWNDYITQDEDGLNFGRGRNVGAHHQNCGDWEDMLDDDQKVEDDVHPDFM